MNTTRKTAARRFANAFGGSLLGLSLALTALPFSASAETVRIPVGQQGADRQVEIPGLGMSKDMVARRFGNPLEQLPARGEPPISRWVYPGFVVYFEYDTVIHAVIQHRPQTES